MKKSILCLILTVAIAVGSFVCCNGEGGGTSTEESENSGEAESSAAAVIGVVDSSTAENSATENSATESSVVESSATESSATESSAAESSAAESSAAESSATESSAAESSATESSTAESSAAESSATESSTAESSATESSAAESSATESSTAESSVVESSATESSAAESSAAESSAAESSATESSAAESSAAESSAAESSAAESSEPESSEPEEVVYGNGDRFLPSASGPIEIPSKLVYEPVDSYFNDSVFIGYSLIMHFGRYVGSWRDPNDIKHFSDSRILGNAKFCAGVGMSFSADESRSVTDPNNPLPKYNGVSYHFDALPAAMGVKSMYIGLMPYSDMKQGIGSTCALTAANYAARGIERIRKANPNLHIVILAGTYNTGVSNGEIDLNRVNNRNIRTYNNYVLSYCNSIGVDFVDVATPVTDGKGNLVMEWSSDGSYHIKQEPYKIWIAVLRDYAERKQAGTWHNLTEMPPLEGK